MRLIDADALLNDLKESAKAAREWREETQDEESRIRAEQSIGTFIECALRVKNAPTIEPEVRHGEWHECWHTDTVCASICTNCGKATTQSRTIVGQELMTNVRYPLCPNCGADMREEGADNG